MPDALINTFRNDLDTKGFFTISYEAEPLVALLEQLKKTHPDVTYVVSPGGRSGFQEIVFLPKLKDKILRLLQAELSVRQPAIDALHKAIAIVESLPSDESGQNEKTHA